MLVSYYIFSYHFGQRASPRISETRKILTLMVATLAKAATADYYVHSQASHRPPDDYYTSGEEPDGVWFNPTDLLGGPDSAMDSAMYNGATIDSADFYKLYRGLHPKTGEKLTRNADSEKRCPAYDMTFNADKTVSALWAIAPPEVREQIQRAHNDAVRVALQDTIAAHCSHTRIRNKDGDLEVVPADIMAALFQHGAARSNDPHLHTHCVILNVARAHHDGGWRALHGAPIFQWVKAAGATYRAEVAWLLRARLGIELEPHGKKNEFTRVAAIPPELLKDWSKRDIQIKDTAARMGVVLDGNGGLHSAVQRMTRAPKAHGLDPDERHRGWTDRARDFIADIAVFVDSLLGKAPEITREQLREVIETLEQLPSEMTRMEAVFRYNDVVERASNATVGLFSREARKTAIERVLRSPELIRLDHPTPGPDATANLAHTRVYTSAHNLQLEQDIHRLATGLASTDQFGIPQERVDQATTRLIAEGYPLSPEQVKAISFASRPGAVAIIEGAAGAGKTTTLRPIADLYRDQGCRLIATAVPWAVSNELGNDIAAPHYCVKKLLNMVNRDQIDINDKTVIFVDEAGMLASSQTRAILHLAHERGAKVIFSGDTQQQQPVEAGPGLRLVSEVTSSVRVDTIRRQQPDIEDKIVAVNQVDRATARLQASLASETREREITEAWDALPEDRKSAIKPWQVQASEHFRDANAASAIEAYDKRDRLHIGRDLQQSLTQLVEDWHIFRTEHPDKSTIVLARTNAEVSVISHLMRELTLAGTDSQRVVIQACRGRDPDAKPSPLELAVGDRIRIGPILVGAFHWENQLFNGTVLNIKELREHEGADGTTRAWIRATTDRGREVSFWHDEMRDYHGKIRLDHGYALTMTSGQGRTVDRAFVFCDQKPARETIYPAATRHRERLDLYIDRKPIELEIREQRPEDEAGEAVTDEQIKAHIAKRWSRLDPKEAARDFMSHRMKARLFPDESRRLDPTHRTGPQWAGANDDGNGAMKQTAKRMNQADTGLRHGAAARRIGETFHDVTDSLQAWSEAASTDGNAAVAMDPAFQADFHESTALLRDAAPFFEGDPVTEQVLREHAGIEPDDLRKLAGQNRKAKGTIDRSLYERQETDPNHRRSPPPRSDIDQAFDVQAFDVQAFDVEAFEEMEFELSQLEPFDHEFQIDAPPPEWIDLDLATLNEPGASEWTIPEPGTSTPTALDRRDRIMATFGRLQAKAEELGIHPAELPEWQDLVFDASNAFDESDLSESDARPLRDIFFTDETWAIALEQQQTAADLTPIPDPAPTPDRDPRPDPQIQPPTALELRDRAIATFEKILLDATHLDTHPTEHPDWSRLLQETKRLFYTADLTEAEADPLADIIVIDEDRTNELEQQQLASSPSPTPAPAAVTYGKFATSYYNALAEAERQDIEIFELQDFHEILTTAGVLLEQGDLPDDDREFVINLLDEHTAWAHPEDQTLPPPGTPVALTSLKESADRDTVFKMLDAAKAATPDLYFIHSQTNSPAIKFAAEWADQNQVDRIVFKPDWENNPGSAIAQRDRDMIDARPAALIDFTTTDKTTGLADLARERGIIVIPVSPSDRRRDPSRTHLRADTPPSHLSPDDRCIELDKRIGLHTTTAEKIGISRFDIPDWHEIVRDARDLLDNDAVSSYMRIGLRRIVTEYRDHLGKDAEACDIDLRIPDESRGWGL